MPTATGNWTTVDPSAEPRSTTRQAVTCRVQHPIIIIIIIIIIGGLQIIETDAKAT
jgi:hypothetical protein